MTAKKRVAPFANVAGRREVVDGAKPARSVAYFPTFGFAQLDTSRTGTLVYRRNEAGGQFFAEWLDANGKAEPLSLKPGNYAWPRLSPDGQRVAFSAVESGTTTTLVYNIRANRIARAGSIAEGYMAPLWTPDGNGRILGSAKGHGLVVSR